MEYQKAKNLLENTSNQPTKFRTKKWVEVNDVSRGTYHTNSQIKFKTSMLRSSLCDYSDAYILAKLTNSIERVAAPSQADKSDEVVFKMCTPFTNCIGEINNNQTDNAKNIDEIMPMYNLIECRDNYSKSIRKFMAI